MTPYPYLDNIVLTGAAVPEPAATLLMSFGLAPLAIGIRRRKKLTATPIIIASRTPEAESGGHCLAALLPVAAGLSVP